MTAQSRGPGEHAGAAVNRPEITEDSIEGNLQRNDALRVLNLALASNGIVVSPRMLGSILRDIEEGGYTLRLTTHAERAAKNDEWGPSR